MNVSNVLDENGRPLLLKVRALKSGAIDDIEFFVGAVMQLELGTALKLIRLGFCERKNPRRSIAKRRRQKAAKLLKEAQNASTS
jgi:hypothetical protein